MCRCHVILANLRPPGQKGYVIPRGFLFEYITCPNYTLESLGWVLFTVATSTLPALFFGAAGTFQMAQWAIAKHARLRKVCANFNLLLVRLPLECRSVADLKRQTMVLSRLQKNADKSIPLAICFTMSAGRTVGIACPDFAMKMAFPRVLRMTCVICADF